MGLGNLFGEIELYARRGVKLDDLMPHICLLQNSFIQPRAVFVGKLQHAAFVLQMRHQIADFVLSVAWGDFAPAPHPIKEIRV